MSVLEGKNKKTNYANTAAVGVCFCPPALTFKYTHTHIYIYIYAAQGNINLFTSESYEFSNNIHLLFDYFCSEKLI